MFYLFIGVLIGWVIWGNNGTIATRAQMVKDFVTTSFYRIVGKG